MIELYTWTTPNGRKVPIMLEEVGLPYNVHPINLGKGEQHDPAFLKISPNNKIPAIVDTEGPGGPLSIFESGAILIYLAEKTGRLLASHGAERYRTLEWLNWQIGGIGPVFGQLGFFAIRSEEKSPLAIKRFTDESERLIGVIDRRLAGMPLSRRRPLLDRRYRRLSMDAGGEDLPRPVARTNHRRQTGDPPLARRGRRARSGQARDGRAEGVSRISRSGVNRLGGTVKGSRPSAPEQPTTVTTAAVPACLEPSDAVVQAVEIFGLRRRLLVVDQRRRCGAGADARRRRAERRGRHRSRQLAGRREQRRP